MKKNKEKFEEFVEKEKVYKPVIVKLDMSNESARKLNLILNRIKEYGYEFEVPKEIVERAIAEEVGYSSSTISMFKRHLLNFGILIKKSNKVYGINIIKDEPRKIPEYKPETIYLNAKKEKEK